MKAGNACMDYLQTDMQEGRVHFIPPGLVPIIKIRGTWVPFPMDTIASTLPYLRY